jgi:TolA-binding protein
VYTDDRVKDLIVERFIPVRVHVRENRDEYQQLGSRYGVQWTPTILVVDAGGEERHRIEGFLPTRDFLSQVELGAAHGAFKRGDHAKAERLFREVASRYADTDAAPEALYWAGVSKYRATNDPAALKETAAAFTARYIGSAWAKKASVWQ